MFEYLIKHGCPDLTDAMDPERYSSNMIAGGSFGDIWKGRLKNGTEVAIKMWRFTSITEDGKKNVKVSRCFICALLKYQGYDSMICCRQRAMRELYNWSKANHENVHKLLGVIIFKERLGMVSKWMEPGNLREYMERNESVDRYHLVSGSIDIIRLRVLSLG